MWILYWKTKMSSLWVFLIPHNQTIIQSSRNPTTKYIFHFAYDINTVKIKNNQLKRELMRPINDPVQ